MLSSVPPCYVWKRRKHAPVVTCQSTSRQLIPELPHDQLVGSLTAGPHDQFARLLQNKYEKRKNSMVLLSHEQVLIPGTTICQDSINELLFLL